MMQRVVSVILAGLIGASAMAQPRQRVPQAGPAATFSQILGRPTDRAVTLSILSASAAEAYVEYGLERGTYPQRTPTQTIAAGVPAEFELTGLTPSSRHQYRVRSRSPGAEEFALGTEAAFHTQRKPGDSFVFALQGDSHPERAGRMYDPALYEQTMRNVAKDAPDFYLTMGDDFSIERLIEQKALSQPAVDAVYAHQRGFLGLVGASSALFLVNGNHEQAAKYLLDGSPNNAAVLAGRARTRFYPLPAPDAFYTGNSEEVEHIGLVRDYYAWTWGDALFVVIDPYWHSDVAVDNEAGVKAPPRGDEQSSGRKRGTSQPASNETTAAQPATTERRGKGNRDLWQITLGNTQYAWLTRTLTQSTAKYKFVFSHHVLGTGRGGVEVAGQFEWGGLDRRGVDRFFEMRPAWDKPIHDLMRDTGVTIFFQGHDHLYARQELDGVTYQTVPNPADPTFTAFNREAYKSGDIFPNSGHLRVTVSPDEARVEYVRSLRTQDETTENHNGSITHTYTVTPRTPTSGGR